jgi:hypothetical protein
MAARAKALPPRHIVLESAHDAQGKVGPADAGDQPAEDNADVARAVDVDAHRIGSNGVAQEIARGIVCF